MKWFNNKSLDALAGCVNSGDLKVAQAAQEAVKGIYADMELIEQRLAALEQNAVAVQYSAADKRLNIVPAASAGTKTAVEGEDGTDGIK